MEKRDPLARALDAVPQHEVAAAGKRVGEATAGELRNKAREEVNRMTGRHLDHGKNVHER